MPKKEKYEWDPQRLLCLRARFPASEEQIGPFLRPYWLEGKDESGSLEHPLMPTAEEIRGEERNYDREPTPYAKIRVAKQDLAEAFELTPKDIPWRPRSQRRGEEWARIGRFLVQAGMHGLHVLFFLLIGGFLLLFVDLERALHEMGIFGGGLVVGTAIALGYGLTKAACESRAARQRKAFVESLAVLQACYDVAVERREAPVT